MMKTRKHERESSRSLPSPGTARSSSPRARPGHLSISYRCSERALTVAHGDGAPGETTEQHSKPRLGWEVHGNIYKRRDCPLRKLTSRNRC
ncbi:hypothetical protein RRG08_052470 [Elysia crispata]|uniref:Uncharacterized protein n=1 Tax=Elysia crispata TaxID=231223 RepID=A0AAE1B2V0_9GAST|nr:hypothetical protein RRG08_052470 [Elysia crispata]